MSLNAEWVAEGVYRTSGATEEPSHKRQSTIEREERQETFGGFDPNAGFCPKCFMIRCANGKCSGGCDD